MMFTLLDWVLFVAIGILLIIGAIAMFVDETTIGAKIIVIVIEVALMAAIIGGCAMYNTRTESGKRSVKSWKSETSGGINRTVTVYDINGEEVAKYTGRFDIEETSQEGVVKIKFDCDGRRHIIYAQTGTVLIDENEEAAQ